MQGFKKGRDLGKEWGFGKERNLGKAGEWERGIWERQGFGKGRDIGKRDLGKEGRKETTNA